ncbi:hypothetical protein, partial [Bacillus pumilus]|uniref:hypothetical protein n=1 Tax=Bacillus pumilus TaxID=1408 RepID=UPI001C92F2D6
GGMVGAFMGGIGYVVIGVFIKWVGRGWVMKVVGGVVVGGVIMVMGVGVGGRGVKMGMYVDGNGSELV